MSRQLFRSPTITHTGFSSVLSCCLWGARGILYWELLSQDTTVTASTYTHLLKKILQITLEKRPNSENVHLLQGKDRSHDAIETQQTLTNLGWKTVSHPLYSPDFALSIYHLFHPLKQFLASKSFAKYEDPKLALSDFFDSQLPEFWAKGISDLPIRWTTVVDNLGDYIVD